MPVKKGDRHDGMFKPGQSGNPNGRPKGAKNRSKLPRIERVLLNSEEETIRQMIAMAQNDVEKMNRKSDIPASAQFNAMNRVLELIKEVKEKLEDMDDDEEVGSRGGVTELFSTKAQ